MSQAFIDNWELMQQLADSCSVSSAEPREQLETSFGSDEVIQFDCVNPSDEDEIRRITAQVHGCEPNKVAIDGRTLVLVCSVEGAWKQTLVVASSDPFGSFSWSSDPAVTCPSVDTIDGAWVADINTQACYRYDHPLHPNYSG